MNETVGFASIGDVTGLFPIGYMDRIKYARYPGAFTLEDDVYIVNKVVEDYIYGWKYHLEDGTISRPVSWLDEGYIEIHGEVKRNQTRSVDR